jgi:hypothetical protein
MEERKEGILSSKDRGGRRGQDVNEKRKQFASERVNELPKSKMEEGNKGKNIVGVL